MDRRDRGVVTLYNRFDLVLENNLHYNGNRKCIRDV